MAHGYGRVMAVSAATDLARSTINREIREVCSNRHEVVERVRRPGAGRKTAVTHQPGLPAALETLIEDAIRGDPCAAALGRPQPTPSGQSAGGAGVRGKPMGYKMQLPSQPHDARGVQSPRSRCTVSAYQCDGEGSDGRGRAGDRWIQRRRNWLVEAPWQAFFTGAPERRREFEPSSKRRKRRPVSSPVHRQPENPRPQLRYHPQLRQTSQGTEVENTVPDAITRIQDVFFAV
jgi:hypothetical protein